jgi:hypothetical protein
MLRTGVIGELCGGFVFDGWEEVRCSSLALLWYTVSITCKNHCDVGDSSNYWTSLR